MKHLSNDDKETLSVLAAFAVALTIILAMASLTTWIRPHTPSTPKHYDTQCVTNYVKYPLKECIYKEAE